MRVVWKDPEVWGLGLPFNFRGLGVCPWPSFSARLNESDKNKFPRAKGIAMLRDFARRSSLLFAVVFLLLPGIARPQTGTTSLRGSITDRTGGAIPGVKVTLKNAALSVERITTTGNTGQYEFLALPPGTYELAVEKQNFQRYLQSNLQLLVNSPATQDVQFQVGSSTETVEVSSQAEMLNTTDASLGNAFSERQVRELPLEAGNVPELLSLQAGVTYTGNRQDINKEIDTRSGAVNGAHSDQSNLTLDGVD